MVRDLTAKVIDRDIVRYSNEAERSRVKARKHPQFTDYYWLWMHRAERADAVVNALRILKHKYADK